MSSIPDARTDNMKPGDVVSGVSYDIYGGIIWFHLPLTFLALSHMWPCSGLVSSKDYYCLPESLCY